MGDLILTVSLWINLLSLLVIKDVKPRQSYFITTGNRAKPNWIKLNDVVKLMSLIDSKIPAYSLVQAISSNLPNDVTTIGCYALDLIDCYRLKKEYPRSLTFSGNIDTMTRLNIVRWYESIKNN